MTLQQIEYIISLDNHKNFVKAAKQCLVTQPTLTMQIQKLENEIGFRIFDRNSKPVKPTKLGEQFISKARIIHREVNELKAMVEDDLNTLKGEFRLGIIPTLAPYLLPLFLPHFSEKYSETHLVIEELQSEDIIQKLKIGLLDIAILATPVFEKQLREIPVFVEPFLAYLEPENPLLNKKLIDSNDLDLEKILLLSEGHCFRNQTLNICKQKKTNGFQKFTYSSGSIETIKALVDKGLGYTLIPELSILPEGQNNKNIKRFNKPEPVREVSLLVHSGFTKELLLENIRKSITENLPENFSKNERFVRVKWR